MASMVFGKKGKRFLAEKGFGLLLFAALFALFLLLGREGPVLFDDSENYTRIRWREGVMPGYPMFMLGNQYLFGAGTYLWAAITEQAVLAAFSIVLLTETVRRRMGLYYVEACICAVLLLYPYTIEMPTAVMTQAVLTEGISYSLFYFFLAVLLKAVWDKSFGWLCGAFFMAALLTTVRSQMQMIFGVCGIVFFYLICMSGKKAGKGKKALRTLTGIGGCVLISLLGIIFAAGIVSGYKAMVQGTDGFNLFVMRVQEPEKYQASPEAQKKPESAEQTEQPEKETEKKSENDPRKKPFATSQYLTLIFSRGMYEADLEDAALFQDETLRGLYLALYDDVDSAQQRYAYAEPGLWMWQDIVDGIGRIGMTCFWTPSDYYAENASQIFASEQFSDIRHNHMQMIGLTLIKAHFGRFLYHTLMLLPQAFVSTVFFQYAPLYLLCHLIAAFLYLSAAALMIWGYRDERARKEGAEMIALVLGTNVVMVVIISLVFFGQQRYLVYAFGPFYIAYYVMLRQLWCVRIRGIIKKLPPDRKTEYV